MTPVAGRNANLVAAPAPTTSTDRHAGRVSAVAPGTGLRGRLPSLPGWLPSERVLSFLLVLVVASVLRLPLPDLTPFGHDEALEAERARPIWYGARPVDSEVTSWWIPDPAGLLYYFSLAEAFPKPAIARVVQMAATNVLSVLLCYLLARRFFGPAVGLVAGLFYAVNPWAVTFGRQPWVITQPLLTTIMLFAAMMVVVRRDRRWVVPFFLAGAAQTQTHLLAVLFGPPVLLTLVLFVRRWLVPQSLVGIALAVVTVAPYALHLLVLWPEIAEALGRGNRGITLLPDPTALTLTSWLISGFNLERKLGFSDGAMLLLRGPLLFVAALAAALLALGIVRSAVSCVRREPAWRADALLLIWLLAPLTLMTWQSSQVYIHYVLCLVPVPFLLMARGAACLASGGGVRWPVRPILRPIGVAVVACIVLVQAVTVGAFYAAIDRIATAPPSGTTATDWQLALNRNDLTARQLGIGELHGLPLRYWQRVADETRVVAERASLTDVVVVSGALDDANRHLDRRRKAMNYLLGPGLAPRFPLEGLVVVPTVRDQLFLTLPDEELPRSVQRAATRLVEVPQPGTSSATRVFQVRARPPDDVITLRRRANVSVGQGVRLVVLDVPTDVRPGQTTPLAAYLLVEDAETLSSGDLAPTVELVDANGAIRTFARRGGLPLAEWRTGDLLIQQMSFTVPVDLPPGDYELRLSLREGAGGSQSEPVRAAILRVRSGP
jgi:4-amino-4-deoxy-L-arabinose transferase-like glycosyltransferase